MATPAIRLPNTPSKLVISQIKWDDDGIYPDGRNFQNMVTKEMNTECDLFVNNTPNVILCVQKQLRISVSDSGKWHMDWSHTEREQSVLQKYLL